MFSLAAMVCIRVAWFNERFVFDKCKIFYSGYNNSHFCGGDSSFEAYDMLLRRSDWFGLEVEVIS